MHGEGLEQRYRRAALSVQVVQRADGFDWVTAFDRKHRGMEGGFATPDE